MLWLFQVLPAIAVFLEKLLLLNTCAVHLVSPGPYGYDLLNSLKKTHEIRETRKKGKQIVAEAGGKIYSLFKKMLFAVITIL